RRASHRGGFQRQRLRPGSGPQSGQSAARSRGRSAGPPRRAAGRLHDGPRPHPRRPGGRASPGPGCGGALRRGGYRGPARARRGPAQPRRFSRSSAGARRGNMKGFGNLVKEAQKLQAQLEALKEEVGKRKVEASSGGGMVVVEANGAQEVLSIKIDREVITPDDPQMLEDLVLAAVNEALRKAREMVAQEMSKIAGGLGGKLPGMF